MAKRTNYSRGREIEYKIIEQLKKEGFPFVVRTAGSHSPFDIIAIGNGMVLLIQSKRCKKKINVDNVYKEDLGVIKEIAEYLPSNTQIEFWLWQDRKGFVEKKVLKQFGEQVS